MMRQIIVRLDDPFEGTIACGVKVGRKPPTAGYVGTDPQEALRWVKKELDKHAKARRQNEIEWNDGESPKDPLFDDEDTD